ncbi:MAG: hypothetical protein AUK28_00370 [Desulfobacterales bacterium CG2_30_60_27]|nr:MAG: hypothetical protein AUK28_00370 [Desulfobacterales bacterium CG2_30_60_27]
MPFVYTYTIESDPSAPSDLSDGWQKNQTVIRTRPQSGHTQVGPLERPQRFSLKQASQIMKPQGQLRQ